MDIEINNITQVKTLNATEGRVGGYLVVWGDSATRDLQGEYFTPDTDLALDWYAERPVLYHHGLDGKLKAAVIGQIDTLKRDEVGIWAEAQLDMHKRYVRAVLRLVEQGVLAWSSGSLAHLVDVANDGQIKRWPLIEGSLTPTPAEPRRTDVVTLKSAYEALGLDTAKWFATSHTQVNEREQAMQPTPAKTLPLHTTADATPHISISSEFDTVDAMDMLHGYMLLRAGKSFQGVTERYANALSHKINQAGISGMKADELAYSTQTGYGDEWVPELWSAEIWRKARQENVILPLFRSIEMPSNPFEMPIEGTDPSVYYVPETTNDAQLALDSGNTIPSSKVGSGKVQLAAKKLALRVGFSSELVEDAIMPVLNIYREQAVRAIADSIDHLLLNGDTTSGTSNINYAGAAVTGNERFMAFDGLRHLVLVDGDGIAEDIGAAPSLTSMRYTRFLMPSRYAARPSQLAWIVDGNTYAKLLSLPEFLTMDKAGALATAQTGQIGFIDGVPVFVSAEMGLTDATGAVNNSSVSNVKGSALCVYRPGWFVGYRRRIAVNVDYIPYYDSYQLTATVRLAFARFDDSVASGMYNLAV